MLIYNLSAALTDAVEDKVLSESVKVHLPDKNAGREDWLTEHGVETLCQIARATTDVQTSHRGGDAGKALPTKKRPLAHVERFIRVGVQTGTRSEAICEASFEKEEGRPWVDLDNGVFYHRPPWTRDYAQKRYTPAPHAPSVVAEMREWHDAGAPYVVELDGRPVDCRRAFERVVALAKIDKVIVRLAAAHGGHLDDAGGRRPRRGGGAISACPLRRSCVATHTIARPTSGRRRTSSRSARTGRERQ